MAELTPEQAKLFGRVGRWHDAMLKVKEEVVDINKQIARLEEKRDTLQVRVDWFGGRVQAALDDMKARTL